MAGVGDPPFRRLARKGGAGMVCAEMVSANALHFGDERSFRMLAVFPDEHPVSMQIFGSEPPRLADAARRAQDAGADVVDLNCGCPVPKITQNGCGMALMKDESLFGRCVEAMVKAVSVPVTVKMRLGFTPGEVASPRFARLAESAGAAAVSVHARSKEERHKGRPHLEALAQTVAAVGIPVFGNGGVRTLEEARGMMEATGCAGVLIGQAAIGNPYLFRAGEPGGIRERLALLREHARLIVEYYGEELGLRRLRKYMASYVLGMPHAARFREESYRTATLADLEALLARHEGDLLTEN
jgi:nifR3 family TIM-barrel protein